MPRIPLPQIDYSSRDWESIRQSLFNYLKNRFPDDWTDFSESNLGVALIEAVAYAFEVLSFSMDRHVNENFITTARERGSIIKLAALLGYKLHPATSASVAALLDLEQLSGLASPIFISKGSSVSAGDIEFETDRDFSIVRSVAGSSIAYTVNGVATVPFILLVQGRTVTDSFTGTGVKNQTYTVASAPYIDNSVAVYVDSTAWTLVDSLVIGDVDDPTNQDIYEIEIDADDNLTIKFGDGNTGNVVSSGSSIEVEYRVGGGELGNIAAGQIDQAIACTANGVPSTVKVRNYESASGGSDRETIERARTFAPLWGKTTDRAITYDDYFAICNGFSDGQNGRVEKAGIVTSVSDGLSNFVTIYAWAKDAEGKLTTVSPVLKEALRSYLEARKVITVYINPIQDGIDVPVDLEILISTYPGYDREDVKRRCGIILDTLFESSRVRQDNELRMSWIHDYLMSVSGVKSANIRNPQPTTLVYTVGDLGSGILSTQNSVLGQITIITPSARAANYFVNYRITLGASPVSATTHRVIASTASVINGVCVLTVDYPYATYSVGTPYSLSHNRKIKLVGSTPLSSEDVVDHRLVVRGAADSDDIEKACDSFDETDQIVDVNTEFIGAVALGSTVLVTPDLKVSDIKAITLRSLQLDVEDQINAS